MEFTITVQIYSKAYEMRVKRIYQSDQMERYQILAGGRAVVVRNDRPVLLSKPVKRGRPNWKLEQGEVLNAQAFALTLFALENKIEEMENPNPPFVHPKNIK